MYQITIDIPEWLDKECLSSGFEDDKSKMEFVIELAKKNIKKGGGPFGAAIFSGDGELVSCGVNLVLQNKLSILHAEIVAFIMAQSKLGDYNLSRFGYFELFSSSEPCAMCLGACLWSGIRRVVFGAPSEVARNIGFDEGPIFRESWEYLENKGIEVVREVLRDKAAEVLIKYKSENGTIY